VRITQVTVSYFHYDGASPDVIAETDGSGHAIASYAHDATGTVVDSYRCDPWGRVLQASETVPNCVASRFLDT
jgi:hypothetical protein